MECEFATINSNKDEIKEIFENTKTIAIIGCSPDSSKASNKVAVYLKNVGFKIVPVYPKEDEILGEKVYRSLGDIPFKVDMVDIFRKPEVIDKVVDEAIKRGDVDIIWTQLGLVNNDAAKKAKKAGMKVVQNNCTKIEHAAIY
ncbi:CoA-binding protein [Malaciobacter marinus]|uniref:CoA-binding domain-containing protein n=1 Tax=Malaciobacter marinus TaxID=505249 RepID=A0A347TI37_9BACT|nr:MULTISPECIES: CoA-binding protein [Malaciobacter]AXX86265.1 CoA-binding domain-containing protein [Malaciobacter marinus]PHO13586.1 CoA-binding protein [Malaciobacter marinus]PHO14649.1 CoA-binding protein [Malaciobacter marinus]RYA24113.1 CoA-binding protein [Malaciobacter halophilus]